MEKKETDKKVEKIEGIEHLKEGAEEFNKLILSMKDKLQEPALTIVFISGLVGYSCQAALLEKKSKYSIVNTTNGKNYIFGDELNYYLIDSKYSFYKILMGQFCQKMPGLEPIKIEPYIKNVAANIGNENYKIQDKFNPEQIIDFELYKETWEKFYDTLIKYCKNSEEWSILFSISLTNFLNIIDKCYGIVEYVAMVPIALENAFYVSKISQL